MKGVETSGFLTMAKKLGARCTLTKPFRRDQLLDAISDCLG